MEKHSIIEGDFVVTGGVESRSHRKLVKAFQMIQSAKHRTHNNTQYIRQFIFDVS